MISYYYSVYYLIITLYIITHCYYYSVYYYSLLLCISYTE